MNLLKSYEKRNLALIKGAFPNFNLDDENLILFILCKIFDLLGSSKNQNYRKVARKIFLDRNVDFNSPSAEKIFAKKAQEIRAASGESNPLEKIVKSEFMKNFASLFDFSELETYFFVLLVLNSKDKWLFGGTSGCDIPKNADILNRLSGFSVEECASLIERHRKNSRANEQGILFESDGEIKKIVSSYFCNSEFYKKCCPAALSYDLHGDFYSLESLASSNSEDFEVVSSLLRSCYGTRKAVFVSAYGQDDFRLKNFLPYVLKKENFKCALLGFDEIREYLGMLFLFLAFSAQLSKNYAFVISGKTMEELVQGNKIARGLEEPFDPMVYIETFGGDGEEKNSYEEKKKENHVRADFSLLDLVQVPVFILENPFEEEKAVFVSTGINADEEELALPNSKHPKDFASFCSYNWQVKTPGKNEYSSQFAEFMAERGVENSKAEKICETCRHLHILPDEWQKVYEIIDSLEMLSDEEISKVIASKFCTVGNESALRKSAHYNLDVLNTSVPVREVVESLKNAEKWQESEYNFDSGLRILLYGIPGTGKTAFVEYIADELDKPLISIRTSDFMRSKAGDSEKLIKMTFEQAQKTNSILFIDEADSILRERTRLEMNWEVNLVNEFIQHMERFPGILFCSTNLPEFLDKATNRRFHMQIEFKKLEEKGVRTLCGSYFGKYHFLDSQIERIYQSGDVCPGDFYAVSGNIRFSDPKMISASYISELLIKTVKAKNKDAKESIGFGR